MSNFLTAIGLGGLDLGVFSLILLILIIVLIVMLFLQRSRLNRMEDRIERLFAGSDGDSLEDAMVKIFDQYSGLNRTLKANRNDIDDIQDKMRYMIQKVGVIKYNAFKQVGGNLSSAICLLDEDDNGFVLNTVQNIDGCYSYCKSITGGRADVELSEQERDALSQALQNGPQTR